jgi:hypothetical protein
VFSGNTRSDVESRSVWTKYSLNAARRVKLAGFLSPDKARRTQDAINVRPNGESRMLGPQDEADPVVGKSRELGLGYRCGAIERHKSRDKNNVRLADLERLLVIVICSQGRFPHPYVVLTYGCVRCILPRRYGSIDRTRVRMRTPPLRGTLSRSILSVTVSVVRPGTGIDSVSSVE